MPAASLVQPLAAGPVDVVGDVHGEIEALEALLSHLGYESDGHHPDGRRLVFVGDLIDNGPDSPAVIDFVAPLVDAGRAWCVLGNHEVDLPLDQRKPRNSWVYGKPRKFPGFDREVPQRLIGARRRALLMGFLERLPLALERDDLCVVHACWDSGHIERARGETSVSALHRQAVRAEAPDESPESRVRRHNASPVSVLTSGPRQPSAATDGTSAESSERVRWWNAPVEASAPWPGLCVFGHYPRTPLPDKPNPFADRPRNGSVAQGRAIGIDYGVGHRWKKRRDPVAFAAARLRLAALRWPEARLIFDDGEDLPLAE